MPCKQQKRHKNDFSAVELFYLSYWFVICDSEIQFLIVANCFQNIENHQKPYVPSQISK